LIIFLPLSFGTGGNLSTKEGVNHLAIGADILVVIQGFIAASPDQFIGGNVDAPGAVHVDGNQLIFFIHNVHGHRDTIKQRPQDIAGTQELPLIDLQIGVFDLQVL